MVGKCDIKRDPLNDCRHVFKYNDARFDLVVHLAAIVGGRATIDNQPMKVATDLALDSDFFQYVMRTKPRKAVYFSSSAAYPIVLQQGCGLGQRLRETDINLDEVRQPDAIYGWVKLTGEQLARYANNQGANIHVFRPFSGYGGDQDLDYPFPTLIRRALDHVSPFTVWGSLDQVRDWVHIDDVVECVMTALEYEGVEMGPLNICTGRATSFHELVSMMMHEAGGYDNDTSMKVIPGPLGVMYRVGNPTKMQQIYTPRISIEEGIQRAIREARA